MPFQIKSIDEVDAEFLGLPPAVRELFISAFRELAASDQPVVKGSGWYVEALRQNQRVAREGLFSLHAGNLWRGVFFRSESTLVFIGFGYRLPEFYDKLVRLRRTVGQIKG